MKGITLHKETSSIAKPISVSHSGGANPYEPTQKPGVQQ
jgi:hypothetical protein